MAETTEGHRTSGDGGDAWNRLAALYRVEHAGLVRLATLLTDDQAVAEELVQDAFVRLHPRLDSVERPGAYLQTTVINLCRGHHRRRDVADRYQARNPPSASVDDSRAPDGDYVWSALQRLPERRRTALILRFYLERTDDEIAELLDARPGTVRSLISRGLASLRKEFEP